MEPGPRSAAFSFELHFAPKADEGGRAAQGNRKQRLLRSTCVPETPHADKKMPPRAAIRGGH